MSNLKQLGLCIHMYAQDYSENFPQYAAVATAMLDIGTLAPTYVTAAKLYVCPSSSDTATTSLTGPTSLGLSNISYAYARDCTETTSTDTVVMADQSNATVSDKTAAWSTTLTGTVNHSTDGVNALYVDGHMEWVPKGKITDRMVNTAAGYFTANTGAVLRNPGTT